MGRESRADPPQGGLAPTKNYMGARSAHFEQMDVDPCGDNDRQEPIIWSLDVHFPRVVH